MMNLGTSDTAQTTNPQRNTLSRVFYVFSQPASNNFKFSSATRTRHLSRTLNRKHPLIGYQQGYSLI